jgi:hypothetical protein
MLLLCIGFTAHAQEYAVITKETRVYQAPNTKSEHFRQGGNGWITAEKIGKKKGWTKLRFNHIDMNGRCYGNIWGLQTIEVEAWVRNRDLVEVTTGIVKSKFEDGTSVQLNAGVVVTPRKEKGWYSAHTAGERWPIKLKKGQVGVTYTPKRAFDHPEGSFKVARNNFIVAGQPIPKTKGSGFTIRREVENDGVLRHQLGWRCATVMVLGEFEDPGKGGGGTGVLGMLSSNNQVVPPGTEVYWGKQRIGKTRQNLYTRDVEKVGERTCFDFGKSMASGPLRLCVDSSAVKQNAPAKSILGTSPIESGAD